MSEYHGMRAIRRLFQPGGNPPDVRPLVRRLRRFPEFCGLPVHDVEIAPYVLDDDGRRWMLDGSGDVA